MDFEVMYEIPPFRGLYRMVVNASSVMHVEEIIRTDPETAHIRIKSIDEIK